MVLYRNPVGKQRGGSWEVGVKKLGRLVPGI